MNDMRFALQPLPFSLLNHPAGPAVSALIEASLRAADPATAVLHHLRRHGQTMWAGEKPYRLDDYRRVRLVGFGKAGMPMAEAAAAVLTDRLSEGLVIVKEGYAARPGGAGVDLGSLRVLEAGHPVPDERSIAATRQLLDLLGDGRPDDLVFCLISGGGSALFTSPLPGVSLGDLQLLTSTLLACGATINEINAVRKHLDAVKGGGLARLASPAALVTLILSDVIGSPLDVIASGPAVPDPTTFADAWQVLAGYDLLDKVPPSIVETLAAGCRGSLPETPKPGDLLFERVENVVVGSNLLAAQAACQQAQALGMNTCLLTTYLQGEARQAGSFLAAVARQVRLTGEPLPPPACLVVGGETTVTLTGGGKGGRNQELALGAAAGLAGLANTLLVTLATDGGDGPTDAAGAIVTGDTCRRAHQVGLDPAQYLAANDSYNFFAALGDLVITGPTQTNVNDLALVLVL